MKSNEKYVFSLIYYPRRGLCCRSAKFYLNVPGDFDHVIILTSSTQLVALVYKWTNGGSVENLNLMGFFSG